MRFPKSLTIGLALAIPVVLLHSRVQADGPIANLLHLHHGDCDAKQSVVRLPAQEIRIETTQPRVIVNQGTGYSRMRGGYLAQNNAAFMPMVQGPFVATVLPMTSMTCGNSGSGSAALDAIQAMQIHHLNFAKQQAALQKEVEITNQLAREAADRLAATLKASSPPSADSASVANQLQCITNRLDSIEKLLKYHDNAIQKLPLPKN